MYDEVKEDDFGSTSSSKNADHKEQFVRASVEEGKLAQDGDGCRFTATIIVSGAVGNVHVARTYVSVAENYCSSYDRAIRINTTRVTSFTAHPLAHTCCHCPPQYRSAVYAYVVCNVAG